MTDTLGASPLFNVVTEGAVGADPSGMGGRNVSGAQMGSAYHNQVIQTIDRSPFSSAFGTSHPADVALGKARFIGSIAKSSAKMSAGDMLSVARDIKASGDNGAPAPQPQGGM